MGQLLDAVQSGDRRRILVALRDDVAATIEDTRSGRDMAALSKRLMEICAELDAIPNPDDEANPIDEMAAMIAEYDNYDDEDEG